MPVKEIGRWTEDGNHWPTNQARSMKAFPLATRFNGELNPSISLLKQSHSKHAVIGKRSQLLVLSAELSSH